MDCEQDDISTELLTGTDDFIEEALHRSSNFSETQISKLKSDLQHITKMDEFKKRLCKYESREWDNEEHKKSMEYIDLDASLRIICRTGPFDLNSKEALALMVCAGLISCSDPGTAARTLQAFTRWTSRRPDPLRNHEFLTQTMFTEVLRWSLDQKLHFRSDYGDTIAETLQSLQKASKFFKTEKTQLRQTIDNILPRLEFRQYEFIRDAMLKIWYVYCEQDESELDFFRSAYLQYCFRFKSNQNDAFLWETELRKICEYEPLGARDLYKHDPLDALIRWAEEDNICAKERFHKSSKSISDDNNIEREFNPTIEIQCIRELCLMAAFDVCDPQTVDVFRAIKCLGIGEICEKMYLEEWCSRHPSYTGPESVRKLLLEQNPCSPAEALNILHTNRCKHPVLTFRDNGLLLEQENDTKSKRVGDELQEEKKRKAKKGANTPDAKTSEDLGDDKSELEAQEQAKQKVEILCLHRLLHRVDVQNSSWSCVLSVASQLYPARKEQILDFINHSYRVHLSDLEVRWDAKRGNCLDWGHFLKQHMDVVCSPDLIKQTLPAMVGSELLMFGVLDQQGCKILRFVPNVIPFKSFDLNLNTGLIDYDEKLSLNLIADISVCSDYALAEKLIKQGFNNCLGFFEDNFYQYTERSGAWHRIEKDQAQSLTSKELTILFSRTLHLLQFRESIGLQGMPASTMHKMMRKYCGSHNGVVEVLKAVLPKLRFEPPEEKEHLACFTNGLVDLKSKTLLGPAKPSDYVIRSIPHPYDPNADQSWIKKYVESLFPESVYDDASDILEFHQKHLGSFITRVKRMMPVIIFFVGEGSNGKSVYAQAIRNALGREYHNTIAAEALEKAPGANNDNLYRARYARCSTVVEVEKDCRFHTKTIKNLTGGDETEFNAKYIKGSGETMDLKMHIFCNDIPNFTVKVYDDFALGRRLATVPLRVQFLDANDTTQKERLKNAGHEHWIFPKDEDLAAQLIENGIPGLLAYMVDGAAKLFADGFELKLPRTILTATNQMKFEDADENLRDFVGTQLSRATGLSEETFISTEEITEVYRKLHNTESCLLKSGPFAKNLKTLIAEAFIKQHVEGREMIVRDAKKKRVPSPLGPRELRGYYNLVWKKGSDGAVEAAKLRKTYKEST